VIESPIGISVRLGIVVLVVISAAVEDVAGAADDEVVVSRGGGSLPTVTSSDPHAVASVMMARVEMRCRCISNLPTVLWSV